MNWLRALALWSAASVPVGLAVGWLLRTLHRREEGL